MTPEERRRCATIHVHGLHEPGPLDPLEEPGADPKARMEALWDLTLEFLARTDPNGPEPRLLKSVCRIKRVGD